MPRPNAAILGTSTANAQRMTRAKMEEFNPSGIMLNNAFLNRTPAYYVYIYNAGPVQHRIERPWAHPAVIIPPCEKGEAYSRPFIIPDILAEIVPTVGGRVSMAVNGVDGKFLAQDVLMPEVPNGNWENYRAVELANAGSFGTDLYAQGCWWSLNSDPEVDSPEVLAAQERLRGTSDRLVREANLLAMQGEKGISQIYPKHHRAADLLGITAPWHQQFTSKMECVCGAMIPVSAPRHMPKELCGYVHNWPAAVRHGMATREEAEAAGVELVEADVLPRKKAR